MIPRVVSSARHNVSALWDFLCEQDTSFVPLRAFLRLLENWDQQILAKAF